MRKLIEFLLTRMDTHPEEFLQNRKADVKHNWVHIIKDNKKFMTNEEYDAIWEKYSQINLEQAMEDVTHKLFEPEEKAFNEDSIVDAVKYYTQGRGNSQPSKLVASAAQIKMIQEQYKLYQEKLKAEIEMNKLGGLNESSPY